MAVKSSRFRKTVRALLLSLAFMLVPLALWVHAVKGVEPKKQEPAGWASVVVASSTDQEFADSQLIQMRLVYDPFYRIADMEDVASADFDLAGLPPLLAAQFAARFTDHFPAYVILACARPGFSGRSVDGSLVLKDGARMTEPIQLVATNHPVVQAPRPTDISVSLSSGRVNGVQAIPFILHDLEPCQDDVAPTLRPEATYMARGRGSDIHSGPVILDLAAETSLTKGTFFGIAGPKRSLATPYVGGVPREMSGFSSLRYLVQDNGLLAVSMSSAIVVRDIPDDLAYMSSTPKSSANDSINIVSNYGQPASIVFEESSSAGFWTNLEYSANVLLAVGAGVVAAVIYDIFREGPATERDSNTLRRSSVNKAEGRQALGRVSNSDAPQKADPNPIPKAGLRDQGAGRRRRKRRQRKRRRR